KEDLLSMPIMTTGRLSIQKEISNWLGEEFNHLNVFATYNLIANAAALVKNGIANALTIEGAVNLYDTTTMVFKPLYPELELTVVLAWKKFQPISRAASKFLEYVKSALKA
ncbi:MAG: LysR family transcriptional regulator substrate-binding protein, partial [Ruminococcus flavefaciens]|nr:LysR family transcriptional regulator substrate-binding protein [Ruminococcus flavefaciens]